MKSPIPCACALAAVLWVASGLSAANAPKKVLLVTYAESFQHPGVHSEGGKPSLVETVLSAIGKEVGFELTATSDATKLTVDGLKAYDALFFYTQGDLDKPGIDKGAMRAEDRKVITDFVASGKGFVGTHSGGDTFHGWYEGKDKPYVDMVGCEFTIHGPQQVARVSVVDRSFPACAHLPASFELNDEWYQYHNLDNDMHVLMMLETNGMKGEMYDRPSYPITWCKPFGKGRVFYTGLGHREDVWTNPLYQKMLEQGLRWALGMVDAPTAPTYREASARGSVPDGYTRLFDGRSLDGWKSPGDAPFEVKDGAITAVKGKGGDLFYAERKLKNFELGLEWNVESLSDNSGIWLRSPEVFADEQAMFKVAYEVQIQDDRDDDHRTGAIYSFAKSTSLPTRAAGKWNFFRIRCVGDEYTVFLNDALVCKYDSKTGRSKEGYVALQNHGGAVSFRNIWVKQLP